MAFLKSGLFGKSSKIPVLAEAKRAQGIVGASRKACSEALLREGMKAKAGTPDSPTPYKCGDAPKKLTICPSVFRKGCFFYFKLIIDLS